MVMSFVHMLFFADDGWLLGNNWKEFQIMATELIAALECAGLNVELTKSGWVTTQPDHVKRELIVNGTTVPRSSRFEGLRMLGVPQTFTGDTRTATTARIGATSNYLGVRRGFFLSKLPRTVRVRGSEHFAKPVIQWGSEAATLQEATKRHLDAVQRFTLRSAARVPRIEEETMPAYRRRANGIINKIGFTPWSEVLEEKNSVSLAMRSDMSFSQKRA